MAFDCFQEKFLKVTHFFAPAMNSVLPDSVVHSMFPEKTSCAEVTSILRRYRDIEKSDIEIGQIAILGIVQQIGNYKLSDFFKKPEKLILALSLQSFNSTYFVGLFLGTETTKKKSKNKSWYNL